MPEGQHEPILPEYGKKARRVLGGLLKGENQDKIKISKASSLPGGREKAYGSKGVLGFYPETITPRLQLKKLETESQDRGGKDL
jgi:hypothetical protein